MYVLAFVRSKQHVHKRCIPSNFAHAHFSHFYRSLNLSISISVYVSLPLSLSIPMPLSLPLSLHLFIASFCRLPLCSYILFLSPLIISLYYIAIHLSPFHYITIHLSPFRYVISIGYRSSLFLDQIVVA